MGQEAALVQSSPQKCAAVVAPRAWLQGLHDTIAGDQAVPRRSLAGLCSHKSQGTMGPMSGPEESFFALHLSFQEKAQQLRAPSLG